jgi:hypothetical protein
MAIAHLAPTLATIKSLYATAFVCGHPECPRPLYQEDLKTGQWTLNSRICHINARSEGGPRWNAEQSAMQNRAETNLLLLCPEHASLIDDLKTRDFYSSELLREWKAGQINDYRQRMSGWPLTTAMAEGAISASFQNVDIAINAESIILAGQGGNAPGAGGGGGGAIGRGSKAGNGGNGGQLNIDRSDLVPTEIAKETLSDVFKGFDFGAESPPGSGGGGAGAIGDDQVAGDGGNGGDIVSFCIEIDPEDKVEVEVGKGGVFSNLPGAHGQDGEDSLLRITTADGKLKRIIRAKGGSGGKRGIIPDDMAQISEADLAGGFSVTTMLLANTIEMQNGLLYTLGGGWETCIVPTFPFDLICRFVCIVGWDALPNNQNRGLQLCMTGPDGKETSRLLLILPVDSLPENSKSYRWANQIGAAVHCAGNWTFHLQSGGYLLSKITLTVQAANHM